MEATPIDIEAAWVVAHSREADCGPVVGSGRRCAQDGRERPPKRVARTNALGEVVCGGDDDDMIHTMPGDEDDDVHGSVIGGVCGMLQLEECVVCPVDAPFVPRSVRESMMDRGEVPLYHGLHGPPQNDNVHGCVRDLVVQIGDQGSGGWWESDGLPRSGERVALCQKRGCHGVAEHYADRDGLFCSYVAAIPDAVKRGVLFVSTACSRTCASCGITHRSRESMFLCLGCHSLAPFVRSGTSSGNFDADAVLEERYVCTPAYCDLSCQVAHWPEHSKYCHRDDVSLYVAACSSLGARPRPYGRVIKGGSRIPFLIQSTTNQPGALDGWGVT